MEPNRLIELTNEIKSIDLFNDKRAFIINSANFFQIKSHKFKKKELEYFIDALNTTQDLIIINLTKKINFKNNYINSILKKEYIEFTNEQKACSYFLNLFIESHDIKINGDALELMKYNLNNNILLIENELLKLQSFVNYNFISVQTISSFGIKTIEANSFNLLELILIQNKKDAKHLYDDIITNGTNPVSLLGLISSQIRFLYQIKTLNVQHSTNEITQILNTNSYRVKINLKQAQKFSIVQLSNLYLTVAKLDYLIKSGQLQQDLIFDYLLYD